MSIHISIFSCKTTLPKGTKLDWDLDREDADLYKWENYKIVFSHVSGNKNGNVILFCMKSILRNRDSILYKL
jgi:hypothetical protein